MNAREIAAHLRGRKNGSHGWLVKCPAHDDRSPSLSIKDSEQTGRLLVRCFGGCDARSVLDAFRGLGYLDGLQKDLPKYVLSQLTAAEDELEAKRRKWALKIWQEAAPAPSTIVERYLRSRGYEGHIRETLRFHPHLRHPDGKNHYPGMVAAIAIAPQHAVIAVHRTFLLPDGSGKADNDSQKAMLGRWNGGAVRLAQAGEQIVIGEGIETTLSAMQLLDLPGWAGLSAAGIQNMILPDTVRRVVVCADRDKITEQHPRGHGLESCEKAAERWRAEGREVVVRLPPEGVKDFNDLLRHKRLAAHTP